MIVFSEYQWEDECADGEKKRRGKEEEVMFVGICRARLR